MISNAIKFSEPDTTILVDSNVSANVAKIKVTDHGLGISEEDQGHLFSSFFIESKIPPPNVMAHLGNRRASSFISFLPVSQ